MGRRDGVERELASRADQRVLRWFLHVEKMDEYCMARRVLMVEVSGGLVQGRPRLHCMDGVKVPRVTEEWWWRLHNNAQKIGKSGEPWCRCNWMSFMQLFGLILCSFGLSPMLWWLSPGEGWDTITWCSWDKLQ